ncbi:MAG TPA: ABC transporter ATP-binding protein [Vicinamibacterales bacterium]|nr:ABC transporter ATP-binding protein [Vicinamibacterales bacterium]
MAPASDSPAIELRDLAKSYGSVHAVRGISLDIRGGEIFGFLGLNGAGKTTTIRVLLDLLRPTRGSARVFGIDCQRRGREARARIGYAPGELGLYSDMTGRQLLDLMASLSAVDVDEAYRLRVIDRLELARADLDRTLREYSTGMKRKLALVQALQADPPLLIFDEPTEGLDPLVQIALNELLFDLRSRGRTVFMSSHVLSEVERLCDRIAVIRAGEIVLLSTVDEARHLSGRTVRVRFSQPVDAAPLPAGMTIVDRAPDRWTIGVPGELGALLPALARLPVRDLEIVEPSLEDVLRRFYREQA